VKTRKISIYIDGAARGNPGPAGAGVVIVDEQGEVLREIYKFLGEVTNNIAEYHALIYGLQEALMLKADEIAIYTDSQLVGRQLKGEYKVKNRDLKRLFDQALHLLSGFSEYRVHCIDRTSNKNADRLANKAINLAGLKR